MKFLLIFSILLLTPYLASANVIINEIAWMGTENSSSDEWIELYNNGEEDVDLFGWILESADGTPSINLQGNIAANSYFLLERTDDTSVLDITADQIYTGALSNSGEYLKLKDDSNNVIDEIDASEEWPAGDNSTKQTMQLINSEWATWDETPRAENKEPSYAPDGASEDDEEISEEISSSETTTGNNFPVARAGNDIIGFINQEITFDGSSSSDPNGYELSYSWNMGNGKLIEEPFFTYKYLYQGTYLVTLMVYNGRNYAWDTITVKIQNQEITINEFIPNPTGTDSEEEWIEIYNGSNSITDVSGWQLDDMDGGSKPFIFPENTLIAPKNYLVFPRTITNIALNNTSDSVRLLLPQGIVFQEVDYEKTKQGMSSARTDEGFVWSVPTPGMANIVSIPEAVGGEKEISFQYEPEKQTVKEYSKEYAIEYSPPEQNIEGGFVAPPSYAPIGATEDKKNELAMVEPLLTPSYAKATEGKQKDQNTLNLVLMIVVVILSGSIIGTLLTKFLKHKPKNPYE